MTIRTTLWKPDTCGCAIEYEWDDSVSEASRAHTFKQGIFCAIHKDMTDIYEKVLDENITKNKVFGLAQVIKSGLLIEDYTWSFDSNRKLTGVFKDKLTVSQKSQLKTSCDKVLGKNKVDII